jgi:hypothetical protein
MIANAAILKGFEKKRTSFLRPDAGVIEHFVGGLC